MGIFGGGGRGDLKTRRISVKFPVTLPAGNVFHLRLCITKHPILQGELIHTLHESQFAKCNHMGISA